LAFLCLSGGEKVSYIYFSDEQKLRFSSVDLVEFLRQHVEKLIRSGPEYRLTSDHSITVRGNEWYDHTAEQGGGPNVIKLSAGQARAAPTVCPALP